MPKLGSTMPNMGIRMAKGAGVRRRSGPVRTGVAAALFTTTQQRLLALLFGQSARSYMASELIALAGVGSGAIQRELVHLVDSGLVTVQAVGRQKHYRANVDAPVFEELRALVIKTMGLAEPLREALAPLASRITLAALYGSVARGEAHAGSDVDLLIVADDLALEALYRVLEPVEQRLARPIHPTVYTTREFAQRRARKDSFVDKVLKSEPIVLLGHIEHGQRTR